MYTSIIRSAVAAAVVASLAGASPALARGPVFGGTTNRSDAIVIRTDAKAKKLTSAVVSWNALCKSGLYWSDSAELAPAESGFAVGKDDLNLSRNRRGRFAGTEVYAHDLGDGTSGGVLVQLSGRTTAKRASGKLRAIVAITDAQGNTQDSCDTGSLTWTASRAPGRIFGGATSQGEPVVVRLSGSATNVTDLDFSWHTQQCNPDAQITFTEGFTDFPIKNHRFGDAFSQAYPQDDGSKDTFEYDIAGRISRTAASGSVRAKLTHSDPSGAQTMTCDSGAISWRALTG